MVGNLGVVMRLPEYRKYFAAAVLAAIGSGMYFVAISWYLFKTSGSTMAIGWAFIATTLPGLLLSPIVGVLVDRWDSKRVCAVADLLRGLILLLLAFGMATGTLLPLHIYVASFFIALCDNFFQPAIGALVRDLVAKERLLSANIVGSMASQVGTLVGASLGGFAVAALGTDAVVGLNACSFFASAALLVWIRHAHRPAGAAPAKAQAEGVIAQFRRAVEETPQRALLLMIVTQQVMAYLTVFICNTLLPGFVVRELHAGAESFGLIDAGWGVGALSGGVLLSLLLKRGSAARVGAACLVAFGLGLATLAVAQSAAHATAAYLVLGCLGVMLRINGDTEIAKTVAPAHFGKIKSGVVMLISWLSLAVYGAVGYLGDTVSSRYIYVSLAGFTLICGVLMLSRPRKPIARPALS
ncbi:MAG: MFS transporter [Rhizobacter sp.]